MDFTTRYKKLNNAQKKAVDTIDGPVMVVAGPGTGKTELLSMRVANILKETDTLPSNILCLTFTDSGAAAMRQRLVSIIGADAYKVAIHTFHSFGADVINTYSHYFYRGASFKPSDELSTYEIIRSIFDELEYDSPLAGTMNGEYTHLKDALATISDLKRSGLTGDELRTILNANDLVIDKAEQELTGVFSQRISASTLALLTPVASKIAEIQESHLPGGITSLSNTLSLSLAHAIDDAVEANSTKPVTAWRNAWMQKDETGAFILKARTRQVKLRAMSHIYHQYLLRMQEAELYDFDDMILQVVHAIEVFPELRYNLQEQYQYIMVDEFQDTNLAQSRILHNLTLNGIDHDMPNILVVGDDDQAIYSFQGADISNVIDFQSTYTRAQLITLTDNYRSGEVILTAAREVISQGEERLENYHDELNKQLTPKQDDVGNFRVIAAQFPHDELQWVVDDIAQKISSGAPPESIAVLARRHTELVELLPYLHNKNVPVSYERQDNILDDSVIQVLELLAQLILAVGEGRLDDANAVLPQIIAHPAFEFDSQDIWKLSLAAHSERRLWLDIMMTNPVFLPLAQWIVTMSQRAHNTPLEDMLDMLIGKTSVDEYALPLYSYYFESATTTKIDFITHLNALRAIRSKLRDYQPDEAPLLQTFLDFIQLHHDMDTRITSITPSTDQVSAVHLMTAHKSKGLEFDHVYIIGAVDSAWGQTVRSRSRLISYPENLPLMIAGNTADERLRLFFVAMTRAKKHLTISYASHLDSGKTLNPANFLLALGSQPVAIESAGEMKDKYEELAWYAPIIANKKQSLAELLAPNLQRYMLTATDLGNFLDVTRGGPQGFLMNNLLKFPQAMSPHAAYGSAIHATLQQAHNHLKATRERRPLEDLLADFTTHLEKWRLSKEDFEIFSQKGTTSLQRFLTETYDTFSPDQKAELSFAHQHVVYKDVRLNGNLDLVDIDSESKTITVTDYKTGKASRSWMGKTDYDKIKLRKYKYQLMFYKLLVEQSRDFSSYTVERGVLQFVEPTPNGDIVALDLSYTAEDLERFTKLLQAIWQHIMTLDLPDISQFEASYKGMVAFEESLLSNQLT